MTSDDLEYHLPHELLGTILEKIMLSKVHDIMGAKRKWPAESIRSALDRAPQIRSFKAALSRGSPAVIAELKKASPSAGVLRPDFNPSALALELQKAGAAALSVLTEVTYFQGGLETLASLRWNARLPLLRKDFVIDSYQVLEARHAGADAVLLIVALLGHESLKALRAEVEGLGMEALVEVHNRPELERAIDSGATLIGVNNRDLRTFEVSLQNCLDMAPLLPKGVVAVAESGIRTREDIRRLCDSGYRGFLIGEQLMRAASPGNALAALIGDKRSRMRSAS